MYSPTEERRAGREGLRGHLVDGGPVPGRELELRGRSGLPGLSGFDRLADQSQHAGRGDPARPRALASGQGQIGKGVTEGPHGCGPFS